jgi:hypothetical protein
MKTYTQPIQLALLLLGSQVAAQTISTQPPAWSITTLGQPATITAGVTGGGSSQWFRSPYSATNAVTGAVTPTLTIPHASIADAKGYKLKVSPSGLYSTVANLTVVDNLPNTTVQKTVGQSVSFTVKAWNAPTVPGTYQWYDNVTNSPLPASGFVPGYGNVTGGQSAILTISNLVASNGNPPTVYAQVTDPLGNSVVTALFQVDVTATLPPMPTGIAGKYVGIMDPGPLNSGTGGMLDLSVTTAGVITGKVKMPGQTDIVLTPAKGYVSGTIVSAGMHNNTVSPPLTVLLAIDSSTSRFVPIFFGLSSSVFRGGQSVGFSGWKQTNRPVAEQGRYNFGMRTVNQTPGTLPEGRSIGSYTVAANGSYAMAGRTPCDEAFTCSAFVGPDATADNVAIYTVQPTPPPSGYTYAISGTFRANPATTQYYLGNVHNGEGTTDNITWTRPANLTKLYPAGFQERLDVYGGKYAAGGNQLATMALATGGVLTLTNACVGLPSGLWSPDRTINYLAGDLVTSGSGATKNTAAPANASYGPAMSTVGVFHTTGLNTTASGFTLVDFSPVTFTNVIRKVKYWGIAVPVPPSVGHPANALVEGYFILPQMPVLPGVQPASYSGLFYIN